MSLNNYDKRNLLCDLHITVIQEIPVERLARRPVKLVTLLAGKVPVGILLPWLLIVQKEAEEDREATIM